jgi:hypothetical protein
MLALYKKKKETREVKLGTRLKRFSNESILVTIAGCRMK